jgi:hypothetical protein
MYLLMGAKPSEIHHDSLCTLKNQFRQTVAGQGCKKSSANGKPLSCICISLRSYAVSTCIQHVIKSSSALRKRNVLTYDHDKYNRLYPSPVRRPTQDIIMAEPVASQHQYFVPQFLRNFSHEFKPQRAAAGNHSLQGANPRMEYGLTNALLIISTYL